jgi:hypothetical protein
MGNWLGGTHLGLTHSQVRLVSSDPGWPEAFQRLAAELRAALGELAVAVEHVGSTAVPGLAAKPILDVAIGLAPGIDPIGVITLLQPLGARFRGDKGDGGGLLLVLEDRPAPPVADLQLVSHGDTQWRRTWRWRTGCAPTKPPARPMHSSRVTSRPSSAATVEPTPPPRRRSSSNCRPRTGARATPGTADQ